MADIPHDMPEDQTPWPEPLDEKLTWWFEHIKRLLDANPLERHAFTIPHTNIVKIGRFYIGLKRILTNYGVGYFISSEKGPVRKEGSPGSYEITFTIIPKHDELR